MLKNLVLDLGCGSLGVLVVLANEKENILDRFENLGVCLADFSLQPFDGGQGLRDLITGLLMLSLVLGVSLLGTGAEFLHLGENSLGSLLHLLERIGDS